MSAAAGAIYTHTHTYIYLHRCIYMHMYIHLSIYIYIYVYTCGLVASSGVKTMVSVCSSGGDIHTHIHTYIHRCIYIYIYTSINLYISICLYLRLSRVLRRKNDGQCLQQRGRRAAVYEVESPVWVCVAQKVELQPQRVRVEAQLNPTEKGGTRVRVNPTCIHIHIHIHIHK